MFTGIIKDKGRVCSIKTNEGILRVEIHTQLNDKHFFHGASIAVNGVCLTVEGYKDGHFHVSIVQETLDKTNLATLEVNSIVNLEPSLSLSSTLDGHFVQGHVDTTAEVLDSGTNFQIRLPKELLKFCPLKGSITINGVSLTIADKFDDVVSIALIPETLSATNLSELSSGDHVNIEVDMIARYLNELI